MGYLELVCGVTIIFLAIYYYLTSTFDFWRSRGVRGPKPELIFGTLKDVTLARKSAADYLIEIYNEYKNESMIGIFSRREPVLVVKDAELIKDILIKEFSKFSNRGIITYDKVCVC
jgi:cytochrome P450 family 6